jgi:hypothetical protein
MRNIKTEIELKTREYHAGISSGKKLEELKKIFLQLKALRKELNKTGEMIAKR